MGIVSLLIDSKWNASINVDLPLLLGPTSTVKPLPGCSLSGIAKDIFVSLVKPLSPFMEIEA